MGGEAMKFLVICRDPADVDQAAFDRLVPDESAAMRRMKANGVLAEAWWSPGRPGAVLMLNAASEQEAAGLVAELPLAAAGLIRTEIIPLQEIDLS